jgi:thiol:disulfide interchange protein DsbC
MNSRLICFLVLTLTVSFSHAAEGDRWYSSEQAQRGEALFRENCAACHGQNAEATANWKQRDADGNFPPPPLNGSAHAWHHDLDLLRRTVREGGKPLGGVMPAFDGQLGAEEIDSVIAFFQSKWPDDIYQKWAGNFGTSDLPSLSDIVVAAKRPLTKLLEQRIGNAKIDDVSKTKIDDVWRVQIGNSYVYLLEGGKYALMGDLVNLETGYNLTEIARRSSIVAALSAFSDEDLVIFEPAGEIRATLDVFTDTSCPYCQKLHSEIGELQAAGVRVRYLPYPRGGSTGPGYQTLKSVWCAQDRNQAMTDAKNNKFDDLPAADCERAAMVDRGYNAGNQVGISGTPALFTSNGEKIEGYRPYQELIPFLLQ